MKRSFRILIFMVSLTVLTTFHVARADVSIRTVALTGTEAMGAEPGEVFQIFVTAGIGGAGDITGEFVLQSSGNGAGIWQLPRGGLVARQGAPAPVVPNATFEMLEAVSGTDSLAVVYKGRLAHNDEVTYKNDDGIWRWSPEGVQLIARKGDPAPGIPGALFEGEFSPLGEGAVANAQGTVAFVHNVDLVNPPSRNQAIWIGDKNATTLVAREGEPAPGVPDGLIYQSEEFFVLFHGLRLNDLGDLAFASALWNPGSGSAGYGLFLRDGTTGTTGPIAITGDEAPGTASETVFENFSDVISINNSQQMAFAAQLKIDVNHGDAREGNDSGIWTGKRGDLELVVREGARAPGTPERVVFSRFDAIGINDSGMILFQASLDDPLGINVDNTNRTGLWFWSPATEQIELVLRSGDAPPGRPDRKFSHPWTFAINDQGLVVMLVESNIPGEFQSRWPSAYAWTSTSGLNKLLEGGNLQRQGGDFIEVAPGDTRQVASFSVTTIAGHNNSDGQTRVLNNRGELVLPIFFPDNTGGLIVVKVDEPLAPPTDPDWKRTKLTRTNTSEAELEVRVGDIDNLGFGWPAGADPFSGVSTPSHTWPWDHDSNDPPGTDRIMVVSSHTGTGPRDGYSTQVDRLNFPTANMPVPVVLNYDTSGINVTSARLQIFVDDFQAALGQATYEVTINGKRAAFVEEAINRINQTGPIGKLLDFKVPTSFLSEVSSGRISLLFDDPHSGIGEGYAIDFVRLLVNPGGGGPTPTDRTVFREGFDALNDGPIDGQGGWISSGTGNTLRVALDSTSNLGGRVVDGLDNPRSASGPWEFTYATRPIDLAGTDDNVLTMTFDAYAVLNSGGLPSHSSGAGLFASSQPANAGFGFRGTSWWFSRTLGGWQFDARFGTPGSDKIATIEGGTDTSVQLGIVVDKRNLQLWGTYDFGNGNAGETARFSVTQEQVDVLDMVELTQDFRFAASRGIEIDNIEVTSGPSTPMSHLPEITDIWVAGDEHDEVKIRWITEPSVTYMVERSPDLKTWETTIDSIPGNGSPVVVTGYISLLGKQQYYRITGELNPLP